MESEQMPAIPSSADDAAYLLAAVDQAGAAMAERLITPWWYHPIYAALTGMIVASVGLPHGWGVPVMIAGTVGLYALLGVYRNLTGLGVMTGGGRRVVMWAALVFVTAIAAIAVILVAARPAVTVIATLAFMPVAILAGRQVDHALRDSLRRQHGWSR
jgi:hypothetical protein